jgi:protein-tyrosine-phosphatase
VSAGTPPVRVLFVCRGNLCRSPIAMALLRHKVAHMAGAPYVLVESAGYHDWGPFPREAHPFARRAVMERCGADLLAEHVARPWSVDMVQCATSIVVAEEWMRADFPCGKLMTMRELAALSGDVADPYGSDYAAYVECARELDFLLSSGWSRLLSMQNST